ncbi:predicted protein [Chaetomium globosum CBS 148.51]|uniref:Uncharacterized protein n=1 Tax=Chaetomium globosum (strain ATCC 6205 / CBS 148.51 / DSM 1962 / NBRC 6347 / NRRL 1970) TaxID=306901 RepID=Q2GVJ2_CHAGB|nr:uncharacterized protein CHGG_08012 [Chaetomium globosum CBS 148.51]EAQ86759.1 predicted protein [Chaetomium globosum CBS 148.51]
MRHEGLTKAQSSLLSQARIGDIGLRDYLFRVKVPEVRTPYCECGKGQGDSGALGGLVPRPAVTKAVGRQRDSVTSGPTNRITGEGPLTSPMVSRTRGVGSTSSGGSVNSIPPPPARPPPAPPILSQGRRTPRIPDVLSGNSLPLPRVRPSRSRTASATGSSRQKPSNLAPIDECRLSHSRELTPPLPNRSPVSALPSTLPSVLPSALPTALPPALPPAPPVVVPPAPSPAPKTQQEEWLHDWQQEVPCELAKSVGWQNSLYPYAVDPLYDPRAPTPTYSMFPPPRSLPVSPMPPPRFVSPSFCHPISPERVFLQRAGVLDADHSRVSTHGRPPLLSSCHNWDPPNRARAHNLVNSARLYPAGQTGPTVGSVPRPRPRLQPTTATSSAMSSSVAAPSPFLLNPLGPTWTATSTPTPTLTPTLAQAQARAPAPAIRDSTMFSTGRFTYYPVMSPYEAEAALGSGGVNMGVYQRVNCAEQEEQEGGQSEQLDSRMFPLLDHDLMSAEQASAAVAAARVVRNTIFIDRGFDIEGVSRASSYYGGDEGEGGLEVVEAAETMEASEEARAAECIVNQASVFQFATISNTGTRKKVPCGESNRIHVTNPTGSMWRILQGPCGESNIYISWSENCISL